MFGLGTIEVAIIGCVSVMLFGGRLPKVARSVGQSIVEFKRGVQGIEGDSHAGHAGHGDRAHDSERVESHR